MPRWISENPDPAPRLAHTIIASWWPWRYWEVTTIAYMGATGDDPLLKLTRLLPGANPRDEYIVHVFKYKRNARITDRYEPWYERRFEDKQVIGAPCVARNADGTLEVFACGTDNALWHISQTSALDWGSNWNSLGGQILAGFPVIPVICVGTNADGRLEVFVRGLDGAVYYSAQNQPNADPGNWAGWQALGKTQKVVQMAVASNADGRMELFAIGTDGVLWHISQTPAPDWGAAWNSLGGTFFGLLTVGTNLDGRLEVFVQGNNYGWWHIWQTAPNAGPSGWSPFLSGDLTVDGLAVASNVDGRLELFAVGDNDGLLYHAWQMAPSNGWNW